MRARPSRGPQACTILRLLPYAQFRFASRWPTLALTRRQPTQLGNNGRDSHALMNPMRHDGRFDIAIMRPSPYSASW